MIMASNLWIEHRSTVLWILMVALVIATGYGFALRRDRQRRPGDRLRRQRERLHRQYSEEIANCRERYDAIKAILEAKGTFSLAEVKLLPGEFGEQAFYERPGSPDDAFQLTFSIDNQDPTLFIGGEDGKARARLAAELKDILGDNFPPLKTRRFQV